jgi:hypothetical protein
VKVVVMIDRPAGAMKAAATPVAARATMSIQGSLASAPSPVKREEDRECDEEDPAPPEEICRAAAEEHESSVTEDVRADDPLQLAGLHGQVGADRRQGHVEHADVDALQEDRAAHHEEHGEGTSGDRGARAGFDLD